MRSSETPAAFQSSGQHARTSLSRESETAAPQASLDQIAGRRRPIRLTMRIANELAWPGRNKLARLTTAEPPPCRLHALPTPFQPDLTVIEEITTSGYTMCVARWSRQWAGARCAAVPLLGPPVVLGERLPVRSVLAGWAERGAHCGSHPCD